jgi:protein-tyrosine phosphatase
VYRIDERFPGLIAILPRPRGGDWLEREVADWKRDGIDVVASLLTPDENRDLELTDEAGELRNAGIEFVSFPIEDRGVPQNAEAFGDLAQELAGKLNAGLTIGVHCRQGIGRSGLLVAALLLAEGIELKRALRLAASARGLPVPETPEQHHWIEEYARRQSALIGAK